MMTLERCISLPCRCFRFSASLDGLAVFFRPPYVPHSPSSWLVKFDDKAAKKLPRTRIYELYNTSYSTSLRHENVVHGTPYDKYVFPITLTKSTLRMSTSD